MEKRELLTTLTVDEVHELVDDNPSTIEPDAPLLVLLKKISTDTRTRHVYVVDEQKHLIGVVRVTTAIKLLFPMLALYSDATEWALSSHINLCGQTVKDVMNKRPRSVQVDTGLKNIARILIEEKISELPVVDNDNVLTGQVNMYEIIKAYLHFHNE